MSKSGRDKRDLEDPAHGREVLGPGLSSHELARRCNLDPSHVSRILRGERKPSIRAARLLSAALDMTLDEFVESIDYSSPE